MGVFIDGWMSECVYGERFSLLLFFVCLRFRGGDDSCHCLPISWQSLGHEKEG